MPFFFLPGLLSMPGCSLFCLFFHLPVSPALLGEWENGCISCMIWPYPWHCTVNAWCRKRTGLAVLVQGEAARIAAILSEAGC